MDVVRRFKIYQEEECGESFEGLDPFAFLETMARSNMNMYRISSIDNLFAMWEMFMYLFKTRTLASGFFFKILHTADAATSLPPTPLEGRDDDFG